MTADFFLWPILTYLWLMEKSFEWLPLFSDSDTLQAWVTILFGFSSHWFHILFAADRGWGYLNHLKNAPSVTSELLGMGPKHLSTSLVLTHFFIYLFIFFVGTVSLFGFRRTRFCYFINIFQKQHGKSSKKGAGVSRRYKFPSCTVCWEETGIVYTHSSVASWEINSN